MKRVTLALWLSVSAIALITIVYGTSFHQSPDAVKSPLGEAGRGHQAATVAMKQDTSTVVVKQRAENDLRKGDDHENPVVKDAQQDIRLDDEAYTRRWVREETTREVHEDYALLFKHLDLPSSESKALLEFLIEDSIARTKTIYSDGIGMDKHERSARIAAIVGDAKHQQFLALERNLGEYRETQRIQSMLELNDIALTETQLDGFLKILIDVREQVDMKRPAHLEPGSIESLEHTLNQIDESERLTLELASSVLSAKQVEHMFERNQAHSYRRADVLESHKQQRADNPEDDFLLGYPSKRN